VELSAFTKFDPRAFLEIEERERAPAKAANSANEAEQSRTLATLAALARSVPVTSNYVTPASTTWGEVEEERAAIVEHDAGASRSWAEALAMLDPTKPPGEVPRKRWLQFIDDCSRFLDAGWAQHAEALGWGPLDLFGCDRQRPWARIDQQGLLWLLNGSQIVELHRDKAVIEISPGTRQSYRRRPVEVGRVVLVWELSP
jgi:hypothetical protein